jgi:hypothetical protein
VSRQTLILHPRNAYSDGPFEPVGIQPANNIATDSAKHMFVDIILIVRRWLGERTTAARAVGYERHDFQAVDADGTTNVVHEYRAIYDIPADLDAGFRDRFHKILLE